MRLLSVPDVPGYQVDVENAVVYKMKYGVLREVNARTKYKSFTIQVNGQTIGTTVYRMMYCAINGIPLLRIPTDICISMEDGQLVVLDRSEVIRKTNEARKRHEEKLDQIKANMELIERYYKGDTEPILDYLAKVEKSIIWYFIDIRGLCRERAEIIVGNAVNKYLDKLKEGVSSFAIYNTVKRYALGENNRIAREAELTDLIRRRATISAC